MIDPLKPKHYQLYMDMALRSAEESYAKRLRVGCVIVMTTGLISVGWNGMPPGFSNECEYPEDHERAGKTRPEVIHAERNALDKLSRTGALVKGAVVFVTHSPCIDCAKSLWALGVREVIYNEDFNKSQGKEFLETMGIPCTKYSELKVREVLCQNKVETTT